MEPRHADRDTKLSNKPLTGSDSFQLWRWQVTMGTKAKGLFELLEDTPEQARCNARKQSCHEQDLDEAESIHRTACDELTTAEDRLRQLESQETEDPDIQAQRDSLTATIASRLSTTLKRGHTD